MSISRKYEEVMREAEVFLDSRPELDRTIKRILLCQRDAIEELAKRIESMSGEKET